MDSITIWCFGAAGVGLAVALVERVTSGESPARETPTVAAKPQSRANVPVVLRVRG